MESKSLLGDMRSIFGSSFGDSSPDVRDVQEAIEVSLWEARPRPLPPGPGDFRGRDKMKAALKAQSEKHRSDRSQRRDKTQKDKSYQDTVSALRRDVDAKDKSRPSEKKPEASPKKKDRSELDQALAALKHIVQKSDGGGGGGGAQQAAAAKGGGGGGAAPSGKGGGGGGGGGRHNPFKRSPDLGTGPGNPPGYARVVGPRHHEEKKCWKCSCGNVYKAGCRCVGTGATDDCPAGHVKKVKIKHGYRQAYNKMYHAWRAKQGGQVTARIAKGGR